MLNVRGNALVDYILHNLHPDLTDQVGTPVSTIKHSLHAQADKESFEHLVHALSFRNTGTISIEEKIKLWKRMNLFCNAALHNHNMRGIDSEFSPESTILLPFQNRVNEFAHLLTEIQSYSYSNWGVAVLLANRQPFLFMNAIWDLASDDPGLELISHWERSFYAMFATNRDFRTMCNDVYHRKLRNTNKETILLQKLLN